MNKEVFTQEFCKTFTIYQQVELIKQYLNELQILPSIVNSIDGSTIGEIEYYSPSDDTSNVIYQIDVKNISNKQLYSELYLDKTSAELYNGYWTLSMELDTMNLSCDVEKGMGIIGSTFQNDTRLKMYAGQNEIIIDSADGITINNNKVITGTYNSIQSDVTNTFFDLDKKPELNKTYLIVRNISGVGVNISCILTTKMIEYDLAGNMTSIASSPCILYDVDNDDQHSGVCKLYDSGNTINLIFSPTSPTLQPNLVFYGSSEDILKMYELPF